MADEVCGVCRADVPFSTTVHVLIHTRSDAGVVDYFVCRSCYESDIEPLFAGAEPPPIGPNSAGESEAAGNVTEAGEPHSTPDGETDTADDE